MRAPAAREEFATVTALRGLAALAVCWYHVALWLNFLPQGWVAFSAGGGWMGPHVFFVISGFVVPWALWRGGYRRADFGRFFAKRLIRLEPPYFATIALVLVVEFLRSRIGAQTGVYTIDGTQLLLHIGYLNAFVGEAWLNPVFWSLAIEFQYYFAVALLFPWLCTRDWRWRTLLMVALLVLYLPLHGQAQVTWLTGYLPLFMCGFLLFQRHAGIIGEREFWLWLLVLVPLSFNYSLVMPGLVLLSVCLMLQNRWHGPVTDFLGRISYSLYLTHLPVGASLQRLLLPHIDSDTGRIALAFGTLLFCILAAWIFYLVVERPSQRWAKRLSYRPRTVPTAASTAAVSGG
jgi:peptidoglycan/LPS O-acetylase OafA/YrhL